jgi:hypothetical protein
MERDMTTSSFARAAVLDHTARDDDSSDDLEGLAMVIPRDKLVAMADQVAEMYQGWDRTQLYLAKMGKQLELLQAGQERHDGRIVRLETVLPVTSSDRPQPPSNPPPVQTLAAMLSDYDWEDSPTKSHRVVRVPKRDLETREALRAIAYERDARKWRRATGFVGEVVRAQSKKLIGRAITVIITAAAVYALHHFGLLGRPAMTSSASPEPVRSNGP